MLVEGGANGSSLLVADGDTNTIDTLDASGLTGDVVVEGVQGYVQLGQSGVNLPGAKLPWMQTVRMVSKPLSPEQVMTD